MKYFWFILVCVLAGICAGCGKKSVEEPMAKRVLELEQQVIAIRAEHDRVAGELADLKSRPVSAGQLAPLKAELAKDITTRISANIDTAVQTALDKRVGTTEEINTIFEETAQKTLQAAEAKRQEERQVQQEQWRKTMEERRQQADERRLQEMAEDLKLNDGQKEKMAEISKALREQTQAMMQSMWSGGAEKMTDIPGTVQKLREENEVKIRQVLTEDQFNAYTNSPHNVFGTLSRVLNTVSGDWGRGRRSASSAPSRTPAAEPAQP